MLLAVTRQWCHYQSASILQNPCKMIESDRGLISCIGKFFKPLDNIQGVGSLEINSTAL